MELQFPELLLDVGVLGTPRDRFLHPFRLRKRFLLGAHLDRILFGVLEADEVAEGGRFQGQAAAESR